MLTDLAARPAQAGYRVLRLEPRSIGSSSGPMKNITRHDLGNDVAAVIREVAK